MNSPFPCVCGSAESLAPKDGLPLDSAGLLWRACRDGDAVLAGRMLALGADPNAIPCEGASHFWPPLMKAAERGWPSCVQLLLDAGADAKIRTLRGQTAAMAAARGGFSDCLALLIPSSDMAALDHSGSTALIVASVSNHVECAKLLLSCSDASYQRPGDGRSALMLAARYGRFEVV